MNRSVPRRAAPFAAVSRPFFLGILMAGLQAAMGQAQPQFPVTRTDDAHDAMVGDGVCVAVGGGCTLRAAVEENNYNPDWGIITLPADLPYTLTLGPITIATSTSIQGEDPLTTVIDASQQKAFVMEGTGLFNASFSNLTIKNAYAPVTTTSGLGSAMEFKSPTATGLYRVHFLNNFSGWQGGALYNGGADITMDQCRFIGNKAPLHDGRGVEGRAGAVYNGIGSVMRIHNSTFAENQGTAGGAIFNSATLEVRNSTFSHNGVTFQGGAISNSYRVDPGNPYHVSIAYCTFYMNATWITPEGGRNGPHAPAHDYPGGGALWNGGSMSVGNSILAGNLDSNDQFSNKHYESPDVWSRDFQVTIWDANQNPITLDFAPTFTSFRGNVFGKVDPESWNATDETWPDLRFDQVGIDDPMLGNLAMNGGWVETHAPASNSPAVEHGDGATSASFFNCPLADQRGVPRPPGEAGINGQACDAGAFELSTISGELEAEDAEKSGAFVRGADAAASGGYFASAPNGTGDRLTAPDEAHRLRFRAYVNANEFYNIMGWARGANVSDNSFWVKVDDLAPVLWDLTPLSAQFGQYFMSHRGTGTEENPEFDPYPFFLTKGMHTIDIYLREDGAELDKIQVIPQSALSRIQEVESTSILAGAFMVGKDPLASGGKFAHTPTSYSNASGIPDDAHKLSSVVEVSQAGTYLIRANVQASFDDRNSFWVKVDGLPANGYLWEMTESNSAYGTDYVSHRGNGNSGNPDLDPVELQLAAGPHTIEVFAREGGTRIDRIGLELKQSADMRIVSRGKPATASSQSSSSFPPAKAVDGDAGTNWTSLTGDDQWIRVDLQARHQIDRVMLYWNSAYGKEYDLQISDDGSAWTTLYHKSDGTGGSDNLMLKGTGRYVRMKGIKRGTSGAYSLKEFDVYGTAVPSAFVCQGGCLSAQAVTRYQNAVLNTTGERWFVVSDPIVGWQASQTAGRTISVNGATLQPGQMPLPPRVNGKYYFHFSAGTYSWAAWSFWN